VRPLGPHWELSTADAKRLNNAWHNASRHWSPKVSGKVADHIFLATTLAQIVGPRVVVTVLERRNSPAQPAAVSPPGAVGNGPVTSGTRAGEPPQTSRRPETPGQLDPVSMMQSAGTA
jgi:hypothetical protein